ncbi:hypothetical protein SDJN02_00781, partial [Cucurbita argyrosperma subsp. argyrosperma]
MNVLRIERQPLESVKEFAIFARTNDLSTTVLQCTSCGSRAPREGKPIFGSSSSLSMEESVGSLFVSCGLSV